MFLDDSVPFNLSPAFCAHNGVLVESRSGKDITVCMLDVTNKTLQKKIEKNWPGIDFKFIKITQDDFTLRLSQLFSGTDAEQSIEDRVSDDEATIDSIANDAPIINLLNSIFLEAVSLKASDIHIESETDSVDVRYRIDGRLRMMMHISLERGVALSARLKHLANLNILEKRKPQDGRLSFTCLSKLVDVRISIVPTVKGESIVLRLLDKSDSLLMLSDLGFSECELMKISVCCRQKSGLILVTGPTGSGKTTTLSAILREIQDDQVKIVSIEDPVEYRIHGITQIQTDENLELGFDAILRRVFRQDPDILMVGEIRDSETALLAVRAALTGHLVFATIHTNGALDVIPRLLNLGVQPYLIGAVLSLVVAQRLVRRVCIKCKGSGCALCGKTGYSGRIVVSETLVVNDIFKAFLDTSYCSSELRNKAIVSGFRPFDEDAEFKIVSGITDKSEIARELGFACQ